MTVMPTLLGARPVVPSLISRTTRSRPSHVTRARLLGVIEEYLRNASLTGSANHVQLEDRIRTLTEELAAATSVTDQRSSITRRHHRQTALRAERRVSVNLSSGALPWGTEWLQHLSASNEARMATSTTEQRGQERELAAAR